MEIVVDLETVVDMEIVGSDSQFVQTWPLALFGHGSIGVTAKNEVPSL